MAFSNQQQLFFSLACITICSIVISSGASTSQTAKLPLICTRKCDKSVNSTETEKFCDKHHDLHLDHRCCVNSTTLTVLGIDLQQCHLTRANFANGIANLSQLVVISLEGNPIKQVEGIDFNNNTQIEYLSLPPNLLCPGGNYSWQSEEHLSNHTVCFGELDPCSPPRNYTCPDNSFCIQKGVNITHCPCEKGYHGYKCLNEGDFPFFEFGLGISIPTVILCIFLWFTQRRYVKTRPKDT